MLRLTPLLRVFAGLLLLCASRLALAGEPSEQDKNRAAELVYAADDKRATGAHAEALELYKQADAIMHVPSTGIEVGRELIALGRLVEAQNKLEAVAEHVKQPDEPEAFDRARDEARMMAAELEAKIPKVVVRVTGTPPSAAQIDGRPLDLSALGSPLPVDPGTHEILVRAGTSVAKESVTLAEGETREVSIALAPWGELPPEVASSRSSMSPLVWVGFGVGGAGIIVGSVTGALAYDNTSDLEKKCGIDKACPPGSETDISEAIALSHVSTVSFIVGVAGVGLGVTMLIVSLSDDDNPERAAWAGPYAGPGFVGVVGGF